MIDLKNIKISVIVTVYNVEQYIRQSLDSILCQDYENFEIVLVNDGSPDGSPAICEEYAQRDSRIKLIHQENGGLSFARNTGLTNSTGDYITFIDTDDWIDQGYFSKVIETIQSYTEAIDVVYIPYPAPKNITEKRLYVQPEIRDELIKRFFKNPDLELVSMATVWSLFICRKVIEKNHIRFNPLLRTIGDKPFLLDVMLSATRVVLLPVHYYNYRTNPDSLTKGYLPNRATHVTRSNEEIFRVLTKHNVTSKAVLKRSYNCVLSEYYWMIRNEARNKELILDNPQLKQYYDDNNIKGLLTLGKTLRVGLRNPKWFLIKLGYTNKVLTLFWKRHHRQKK